MFLSQREIERAFYQGVPSSTLEKRVFIIFKKWGLFLQSKVPRILFPERIPGCHF